MATKRINKKPAAASAAAKNTAPAKAPAKAPAAPAAAKAYNKHPLALIILDGFGYRKETEGNAISMAKKARARRGV